MTTQLQSLAKRIPKSYIKTKPGGFAADYCSHADVQQMLIAKLGVPPSQEVTQIIRSSEGQAQGVVLRMVFNIDGQTVVIDEVGECERPWPKRRAEREERRIGCGEAVRYAYRAGPRIVVPGNVCARQGTRHQGGRRQ